VEAIYAGFGIKWLPVASSTLTRFWSRINTVSLSEVLGGKCSLKNILNKSFPKEQLKKLRSKWFIIPAQLGNGQALQSFVYLSEIQK
jgi:hypothetical protein